MIKTLPRLLAYIAILFLLTAFPVARAQAAASLTLSPTGVNVDQNQDVTVTLKIDAGSASVWASQAILKYDAAGLTVKSTANGGFFPNMTPTVNNGTLTLRGYVTNLADARTGNGTLATIVFTGKKTSGSSALTFTCTTGSDTYINDTANNNVLTCSNTNQVNVVYGSSAVPTATPTPDPDEPTPTNSPNTLPTCNSLASDINSGTGTPLTVNFTCTGSDPDGYVNAAYFDFGDGTTNTVVKNVGGQYGAISTSHTYTTIGSLGATCKVQDNNGAWSSVPAACQKLLAISPKPAVRRTYVQLTSNTNANAPAPTPTPTPEIAEVVEVTPTEAPAEELPTPTPEPEKTTNPFGWLLFGSIIVIVVGATIYLISRKGVHVPPPPPPPPAAPPPPMPVA